jgi:DNA-directed RNA polymerase subunit RPC12/RpoP
MSDDNLRKYYANQLKRQEYLKIGFKQGFEAGYAKAKQDFERPHGEWEVIGRETFSPTVTYRCSVCKAKEVSCVPNDKPHYCENCGARMRPKEESEE